MRDAACPLSTRGGGEGSARHCRVRLPGPAGTGRAPHARSGREHARVIPRSKRHLDQRAPQREILSGPACPVSTGGGTRRVQLVRGEGRDVPTLYGRGGGGPGDVLRPRGLGRLAQTRASLRRSPRALPRAPVHVSTGGGTRRVRLVREEGRRVSSQYEREGGGVCVWKRCRGKVRRRGGVAASGCRSENGSKGGRAPRRRKPRRRPCRPAHKDPGGGEGQAPLRKEHGQLLQERQGNFRRDAKTPTAARRRGTSMMGGSARGGAGTCSAPMPG